MKGTLYLALEANTCVCAIHAFSRWVQHSIITVPISSPDTLHVSLEQISSRIVSQLKHSRQGVRQIEILISEAWLPVATMPWSSNLVSPTHRQTAARHYLTDAGFNISATDIVCHERAPYGHERLMVAYPATLVKLLTDLAASVQAPISKILPLGVCAVQLLQKEFVKEMKGTSAQACLTSGLLTVFIRQNRFLTHCKIEQLSEDIDAWGICSLYWHRLRLRHPALADQSVLTVLDISSYTPPSHLPDGMKRVMIPGPLPISLPGSLKLALQNVPCSVAYVPHQPAARKLALVASIVLCLGLAIWIQNLWISKQKLRNEINYSHSQPITTTVAPEQMAQLLSVNQAITQMNLPVMSMLSTLQPTKGSSVALLSVDLQEPSSQQPAKIQITAESSSVDEMGQYIAHVGQHPSVLDATLTHHELSNETSKIRFGMEMTWKR